MPGARVDQRSDVFAIGLVLHELLAGTPVFDGVPDLRIIHRLATGDIPPIAEAWPECPEDLAATLDRALQQDKAERYQSAAEFHQDLEDIAHQHRIRLSTVALGRFLLDRFGDRPYPWLSNVERAPLVRPSLSLSPTPSPTVDIERQRALGPLLAPRESVSEQTTDAGTQIAHKMPLAVLPDPDFGFDTDTDEPGGPATWGGAQSSTDNMHGGTEETPTEYKLDRPPPPVDVQGKRSGWLWAGLVSAAAVAGLAWVAIPSDSAPPTDSSGSEGAQGKAAAPARVAAPPIATERSVDVPSAPPAGVAELLPADRPPAPAPEVRADPQAGEEPSAPASSASGDDTPPPGAKDQAPQEASQPQEGRGHQARRRDAEAQGRAEAQTAPFRRPPSLLKGSRAGAPTSC